MPATAREVYTAAVQSLPPTERLRLAALILDDLARPDVSVVDLGDGWTAEDEREVTAFALSYAADAYPEPDERV